MRKRDHKAEYRRRLERALARGLSRSQARGHAKAGEAGIRAKPATADPKLEAALRALREGGSQSAAAKAAGVSVERFRRWVRENALADRAGRGWRVTDHRPRIMDVISRGAVRTLVLRDLEEASRAGQHENAVKKFLISNDPSYLEPFEGRAVKDTAGNLHPLETDPNALYRLAAARDGFEAVYRIVI